MTPFGPGKGAYEVHNSGAMAKAFLRLQRRATREGRGRELLRAAAAASRRLQTDPLEFGEPLYRLPVLRMQVRSAVIRPLNIEFAVCEDRPIVFIKAVMLLSRGRS